MVAHFIRRSHDGRAVIKLYADDREEILRPLPLRAFRSPAGMEDTAEH
jgi:hypothetical protein